MFLNILRISASLVFKTEAQIGFVLLAIGGYPGRKERNMTIDSKTKLYMHSTVGDVALTNMNIKLYRQEMFPSFCLASKTKVLQPQVLFLACSYLGHFSALRS